MITQSKKIDQSQFEAIRGLVMLFQRIYEINYAGILYEFKILKMPIFGEEKEIGEEAVTGAICKSACDGSLYLKIFHQSYFD